MRNANSGRRIGGAVAVAVIVMVALAAVVSRAAREAQIDDPVSWGFLARTAVLKTSPDGTSCRAAGYFRGRPLGFGAVVMRFTPEAFLTFTLYNKRGSISGRAKRERRPSGSCGKASFKARGRTLTGTGSYEDATGRLRITGTYNSGTGVLTLRARGTVRY